MRLSEYTNIPPSATLEMNKLALEKKRKGERVFNLTAGEPVIAAHHKISEAVCLAMQQGKTSYTPSAGIPELRETAVHWMNETYGSGYSIDNAVVTCGGKHALFLTLQALLNPGDEVIIFSPFWTSYPAMVRLAGGVPKIVETRFEDDWKIDLGTIEPMVSDKTKVVILNNAANPTGSLYSRAELTALLYVLGQNRLTIISDEVYSSLVYDNNEFVSVASFSEISENTVVIQSCSKNFALTGLRVGFTFAPKDLVDRAVNLQSQSNSGTASTSQWAAVEAFKNAAEIITKNLRILQNRRNVMVESLKKSFMREVKAPASALYLFLPLNFFTEDDMNSVDWCAKILRETNVAMVPGSAFGAEGWVRLSFGGEEKEIEQAIAKLAEYLIVFSNQPMSPK